MIIIESYKNVAFKLIKSCVDRIWNFVLNRTKYFEVPKLNIDLDLTTVFGAKKKPACIPDLSPIEHIQEYKYYWESKSF